jgi:hypothetical protein
MRTSRNDPCPCGSGKKYKACCMGRDQARERARSLVGEEAFDQAEAEWLAAARGQKVWAADVVPAPGRVREAPDGMSLVMVTAGEWVAHTDVLSHRPAGAVERARDLAAAVNAAARTLGVLPERVLVPRREVVEELGRQLDGRGIAVAMEDTDHLDDAIDTVLAQMDDSPVHGRMNIALTWRETGASAEELADFHEAAAAFYTAKPWNVKEVPETLRLDFGGQEPPWAASLMGGGGQSFGLVLHSRPEDLQLLWESYDPSSAFLEMSGFTLTVDFDRKSELARGMQREIAAARWPIAGPRAYPRLFTMNLPGRWIGPREVRMATQVLRAVTVLARGGDPLAEAGVGVAPFDTAVEDDSRLHWFTVPERASPVRAEGPGVKAEPRFHMWDTLEEHEATRAAGKELIRGFDDWLREQGVPEEERAVDARNAEAWNWSRGSVASIGAFTEYDLRLFLYDIYVRKTDPTPDAVRALPRSMRRLVRWLEERQGMRCPFAAGVLDELERIVIRGRELEEPLEDTLRILSYDVYDDLDIRVMLPTSVGWPDMMSPEVAQLREELQRRWLLWYDELVRGGLTDFSDLEDALTARQREWERTPHPEVGGRTPAQVVAEYLRRGTLR